MYFYLYPCPLLEVVAVSCNESCLAMGLDNCYHLDRHSEPFYFLDPYKKHWVYSKVTEGL